MTISRIEKYLNKRSQIREFYERGLVTEGERDRLIRERAGAILGVVGSCGAGVPENYPTGEELRGGYDK